MSSIDFSRNLIKGRIAEVCFEQMIREEGRYEVIPFGYEHTIPTLTQYRQHFPLEMQKVIDNVASAPDFALISNDKQQFYLVEVKYQKDLDIERIAEAAGDLLERWESPWIFVATPGAFYCALCSSVKKYNDINRLSESCVTKKRQEEYLGLLNEFEMGNGRHH
jgi:hypothetical protein